MGLADRVRRVRDGHGSGAGEYWSPYLDETFAVLGIPGLLLSLIGSTVLGIGLLRRGFRPRSTSVLLVLWIPLMLVLSNLIALGAATLPFLWAWGLAGRQGHPSRAPEASPQSALAGTT